MPRKPRIEIPGFYHIINRGVEPRAVFEEPADYAYFEELMCFYNAGEDTLRFGEGIVPEDLIVRSEGNDLVVGLREDGVDFDDLADTIRIVNLYYPNQRIEHFAFADGTVWGVEEIASAEE